jgi:hypothetical protein
MKSKKLISDESAGLLISIVKSVTGADPSETSRNGEVVMARKLFFKVFRDVEKWSYYKIGCLFGNDHATVRHHIKDIEHLLTYDKKAVEEYNKTYSAFAKALKMDGENDEEIAMRLSSNGHIYDKFIEINDLIRKQNMYIAEIKCEMVDMRKELRVVSDNNKEYDPIISVMMDMLPKSKIGKAIPKIKELLNGL